MRWFEASLFRRRALLIVTVVVLVSGSIVIGWVAVSWPFWRRALGD